MSVFSDTNEMIRRDVARAERLKARIRKTRKCLHDWDEVLNFYELLNLAEVTRVPLDNSTYQRMRILCIRDDFWLEQAHPPVRWRQEIFRKPTQAIEAIFQVQEPLLHVLRDLSKRYSDLLGEEDHDMGDSE